MQARAGSPFCGVLDALGPPCLTANVRRNPMCVLRVSSNGKTLTDFLSGSRMPYSAAHDKGTPQRFGRDKGKPFGFAGFQSDVSRREWDDLPGQVADAIRFLRRYRADLKQLREKYKVRDMRLDFPYYLRIGRNDVVVQCDYLPPSLILLAGELGVGIEMTLYPSPMPSRKLKRNAEPVAAPNRRPARRRELRQSPKGGGR